jgi:membrane fusion protein, multidrug efflux system
MTPTTEPRFSPKQSLRRFPNPPTLLGVLVTATALTGASCKKQAPAPLPPPRVVVMDITTTNVPLTTEFIGLVDSPTNVEIRARVEAFVQEIPFTEGSNVNSGELLFLLDKKPFQERLAAANGAVAEAKAALKKYEADVARLTPLAKAKAVPQQDLDNALASVDVGKANLQTAEARVESATIDLGYCEVKAPVTGLIGAKQVSIGDFVGRGQPTLLATISTLDPMWFYCNVSEVQYLKAQAEVSRTGKLVREMPVTLLLSDGTEHPAKGKFVFLDRAVDVKTGTFRVRAQFPNPDIRKGQDLSKVLRPGMFGRIRVDLGIRPDSILVPEKAVTELQGKSFVWVVDSDKKASQRSVTVGQQIGENLLITENLRSGERIIVEGLQKARQDQPVQPMTLAEAAEAAAKAAKEAEDKQAETKKAKESQAKHGKE